MNVSSASGTSAYPAAAKSGSGLTTLYQSTSSIAGDDPNVTMLSDMTTIGQAVRTAKEQAEFDYAVALYHRQQPMEQANSALCRRASLSSGQA